MQNAISDLEHVIVTIKREWIKTLKGLDDIEDLDHLDTDNYTSQLVIMRNILKDFSNIKDNISLLHRNNDDEIKAEADSLEQHKNIMLRYLIIDAFSKNSYV